MKGYVLKEYHITWTHKRKLRTIGEITAMLRKIIKEEENRDIPTQAHWEGHIPLKNPVLGTMTYERRHLDATH